MVSWACREGRRGGGLRAGVTVRGCTRRFESPLATNVPEFIRDLIEINFPLSLIGCKYNTVLFCTDTYRTHRPRRAEKFAVAPSPCLAPVPSSIRTFPCPFPLPPPLLCHPASSKAIMPPPPPTRSAVLSAYRRALRVAAALPSADARAYYAAHARQQWRGHADEAVDADGRVAALLARAEDAIAFVAAKVRRLTSLPRPPTFFSPSCSAML